MINLYKKLFIHIVIIIGKNHTCKSDLLGGVVYENHQTNVGSQWNTYK